MSGFIRARCHRLALAVFIAAATLLPTTARRTHAQSSGPVASYAFSEGAGLTTADASGNANTATLAGSVAWASGYFGSGLTLDAMHSGSVQVPMSDSLAEVTNAFTLEAWVNPTDISDYNPVLERRDGSLLLFLGLGGVPCIFATLDGTQYRVCAPVGIAVDTWTHLAATYDGAAMSLYVDGRPFASGVATGTLPATVQPFWIGQPWWGTFAGSIDEVRIYSRALDAGHLLLDRQTPVDPTAPFSVAVHTPLDHAVGVVSTPITAGFSRALDASTLTTSALELRDNANAVVPSSITYSAATRTATLTPAEALQPLTDYTLRVVSGSAGVTDANGHALATDVVWTFTTAAATTTPAAAYAFSEGIGTTTADGSGNGNTATFVQTASWASGYVGNGVTLDGVSGALTVPASETLAAMSHAFTLEAWVKPADITDSNPIIERRDYTLLLFLAPGGVPQLMTQLSGGWQQVRAPGGIPPNTWTHVAATYDGTAMRMYVNGVQVASSAASGSLPDTLLPIDIGRPWWGHYNGSLDEVRLYRTALNATDINADMATPIDTTAPFQVSTETPVDQSIGVLTTPVSAGFSAAVDPSTLTSGTFELRDNTDALVAAAATYDSRTHTATLIPGDALLPGAMYSVRVRGGANGVKAASGALLAADATWAFATASAATAPVAAYAFSEGAGTTAADASGNGNTATLVGTASWGAGASGNGVMFDGAHGSLQVPMSESLAAMTNAFTLEAWVRPLDVSDSNPIFERGDGSQLLFLAPGGTAWLMALLDGTWHQAIAPAPVPVDQWTHIAATADGSTVRLYVNGVQVASSAARGALPATLQPFWIGRPWWGNYNGAIDEVRVYRTALGAADIAADMIAPIDPPPYVPPPPLQVVATTPANGALGVLAAHITATFDRDVDVSTLTSATFTLYTHTGTFVPATISYDAAAHTATLTPNATLLSLKRYDVTVAGGDSGVKDAGGVGMTGSYFRSFTTAADASKPSLAYGFESGSDDAGNGNTPTFVGDPLAVPGWFGDAGAFDGVDDELDAQASQTLMLTNAFTFESWISPTAHGGRIWSQLNAAAAPLYEFALLPAGTVQFSAVTTDGTVSVASTSAIALNTWTHLALSYDGASLRLYVNGVQVAAAVATGSLLPSTEPIRFGAGFTGALDEIRIYRRALNASEIAADIATPIHATFPRVSSVAPGTGVVGQTIVISGSGFNAVQGSSTVTFNDSPMNVTSWNSWQISAIVPPPVPNVTGTVVRVRVGSSSGSGSFTLLQPAIGALDAAATWVGQTVSIQGSGFSVTQGPNTATLNGVPLQVSSWTSSVITFVVPPSATSGPVVVNIYGKASNTKQLTVLPHISALSASSGAIGQTLTLTGTTFGATRGSSTLTFNGTVATVTSWSNTSITATVPQNAGGSEQILVTVGGFASNAAHAWIDPAPAVISLSPTFGHTGQAVGIYGANFGAAQEANGVTFNGATATVISWSDSTITANVPANATSGPVVVTVNGQTSNGVTFTLVTPGNPLTITAQATPVPTAAGWYGVLPDVTFTCTDTAFSVTSCPGHTTVNSDGANIVLARTATDAAGNSGSITLLLNVDRMAPQLSIMSPTASAIFPGGTTAVTVRGTAIDGLSGLQSVSCNGVSATISGSTYACDVAVRDGTNSINVQALDNAGNVTSKSVAIRVGEVVATSLAISPARLTLMAGWGQQLAVTDDLGRAVTGGTWTTSDAAVAQVVINDDLGEVHAMAAGTATLTVTKSTLTATAIVMVLPATATLAPGTTLWELNPSPGGDVGGGLTIPFQRGEVLRAASSDPTGAGLYFVEHSLYEAPTYGSLSNSWPTRIRASSLDGRELWQYTPTTPARQVAVDDNGGMILNLARAPYDAVVPSLTTTEHSIQHLRGDGVVTWEYWPSDASIRISEAAIRPDGAVFFVENRGAGTDAHAQLRALDGPTGAPLGAWPLYNTASSPIVRDDSTVVVATFRQGSNAADRSLWLATLQPDSPSLGLTQVNIDGVSEDYAIGSCCLHSNLKSELYELDRNHLTPDGHGGLLLPTGLQNYLRTMIYRIDATNTVTGFVQINQSEAQVVVGEDSAWVLAQERLKTYLGTPALVEAFDPVSMTILSGQELFYDTPNDFGMNNYYEGPNLTLRNALAGGGIEIDGPRGGNRATIADGIAAGWTTEASAPKLEITDIAVQQVAGKIAARPLGNADNALRFTNPTLGILAKGHQVFFATPFDHSSIWLVPTNQTKWLSDPIWRSKFINHRMEDGSWYATLGAESVPLGCGHMPIPLPSVDAHLVAEPNRADDVNAADRLFFERLKYAARNEDQLIQRLLEASANYRNELPYSCFPTALNGYYNSNSYTHGLLNAVGIAPPTPPSIPILGNVLYPGWQEPVPATEFAPHQP